jgi:hypothetical protein
MRVGTFGVNDHAALQSNKSGVRRYPYRELQGVYRLSYTVDVLLISRNNWTGICSRNFKERLSVIHSE